MRMMVKHMIFTVLLAVVFEEALGAMKCTYGSDCLTIDKVKNKNWWGAQYIQKDSAPCFNDWTPGAYVSSTGNRLMIQRIYIIIGFALLKIFILSILIMFHCSGA